MRKLFIVIAILFLAIGLMFGWGSIREVAAQVVEYFYGDPDMGPFESNLKGMSREEFMLKKAEYIAGLRGVEKDKPFNPQFRIDAISKQEKQEEARAKLPGSNQKDAILAAWTEIGPNPIPNGQVLSGTQLPVSGRTIAIAVHPTNPNIVYVGTAQGGLYRTTDGGTTWTPLLDNALSLAIGAVAIAPSQPDTIYVGTGEGNFSADSFFGVGIYRIDNASTGAPTVTGPLGNASFNGRAVSEIIVHPTDPATIFVASTSGIGGLISAGTSPLPNVGVYRSTNATSGAPTFTQIGVLASPNNNFNVRDIVIDPSNPNILLANLVVGNGGIYRSTNALAATPTWTQIVLMANGTVGTSNIATEFAAIHPVGDTNATFYAATGNVAAGNGAGRILKSTDGGATFAQINATAFCSGQCFYNIAIDVDPTNVNNVYAGGTGLSGTFLRSTNGGTTFTTSQANLHTDSHAIAVAPSLPSTIYFGSDGGIYKSTDGGTTWASLNNTTFRATQFMGLAVHPIDTNFTIGGTQDNGTEYRNSAGTWTRADFGDGGYSAIDQNAINTTNVTIYHTYFNQTNSLIGFSRVSATTCATEGNWAFKGVGAGVFTNACGDVEGSNGINATDAVRFYAPLKLGPGNPNTVYFGTDRLYRSTNRGDTMTVVSQAPITAGVTISAIGISPQNDNVRVVGQSNGGIFGTTTGSTTLTDMDPTNAVPNNAVARVVISPTDANTAYVTLSAFNVVNVWKTTTLSSLMINVAPTWTAANGTGANVLPQVPVNAFVIDPLNTNNIYAGTDIGVYNSIDGGANWVPFGTGLPRVAVFDMAMAPGRIIRIATHGRGMWQIPAIAPSAANVSISGRVVDSSGFGIRNGRVMLTAQNGSVRTAVTNSFGYYRIEDIPSGETYVINARAKGYNFTPRTVNVNDEISGLDIIASP